MKTWIKVISFVFAFFLIISYPSKAYATVVENGSIQYDSVIVLDDVTIASYENDDGDSIVCEFVNGNLTQRNIVFHDQNGIIVCEYYNANGDVQYTKQMNSSDFISVLPQNEIMTYIPSGYSPFGEIQYRVVGYEGYEYYTQVVKIRSSSSNTTCVINAWKGSVVDLVSLIVSSGIAKASIVSSFVGNFLLGAGILIVGGLIKQEITTTVQCTEIEYVWQVYDFAFRNDSYVYGYKYLITETGDNYGEIHYDGITPKDWGTTSMAYAFYNQSYTFSNWAASRWLIDNQNIYI